MLIEEEFIIKESLRKTPRFKGEVIKTKYFRCFCVECGKDRGLLTKSRYKAKPMCVKCSTNTIEHRLTLVENHWVNGGFKPWNKTSKSGMTRAALLKQATPPWLTSEQRIQIRDLYNNCPDGYHVDHIMPLKGQNLSGLHVPWNLQWLPAKDNLSKGNKVS